MNCFDEERTSVFRRSSPWSRTVAKIVLGAAVIDDVLGLVVLAVVQAIIVQGSASFGEVAWLPARRSDS